MELEQNSKLNLKCHCHVNVESTLMSVNGMISKKRIFVYEGERDPGLLSKMTSFMEECCVMKKQSANMAFFYRVVSLLYLFIISYTE